LLAGQGEADGMGNGLVYTADMAKKGISEQIEAYGRWRSDLQSAIERYRDWLAQSDAADASLNVKLSQIIERLHDTLLKVETPEAVDIYLRPASIFSRSRAYLLDLLIRFIWLWLSSWLLSLLIGLLGVNSDVFMMLFFLNLFF